MLDEKTVETLKSLGLTQLQAKLYVALSKTGPATIKSLATTSGIARQDVYRLIDTLLGLGLAEKILSNPKMYKALPLKEGFKLLFENKKIEYTKLHKSTTDIIKKLNSVNHYESGNPEEEQFVINTSRKLVFKIFKEQEKLTKESIDALVDWKMIRRRFYEDFDEFVKLLKRGVKIRYITEKHEKDQAITSKINVLQNSPLFEIRYLSTPPPVYMAIYDKKLARLCVSPSVDNFQDLGSKNMHLLKIMNTYFEDLWEKAETDNATSIGEMIQPIKHTVEF